VIQRMPEEHENLVRFQVQPPKYFNGSVVKWYNSRPIIDYYKFNSCRSYQYRSEVKLIKLNR